MSEMQFIPRIEVHENTITQIPTIEAIIHKPKKRVLKTDIIKPASSHKFTVLTYNVWFGDMYQHERLSKIICNIREKIPDIVCLHELTVDAFNFVDNKLSAYYYIFQAFITEDDPYGSCIMCKKDSVRIVESDDNPYYYDFNKTKMSRRVLGCEVEFIKFSAPAFHILTTHLESLPENDTFRGPQVDTLHGVIKNLKHCIIAGDFGIANVEEEAEKKLQSSKLTDCWVEMGCPYKLKYSYNAKKNVNIRDKGQYRYDRILYHSSKIKVKMLSMIGIDNISQSILIPPSSHYGLLAEFEISTV